MQIRPYTPQTAQNRRQAHPNFNGLIHVIGEGLKERKTLLYHYNNGSNLFTRQEIATFTDPNGKLRTVLAMFLDTPRNLDIEKINKKPFNKLSQEENECEGEKLILNSLKFEKSESGYQYPVLEHENFIGLGYPEGSKISDDPTSMQVVNSVLDAVKRLNPPKL